MVDHPSAPVDPSALDVGLLSLFVGYAAQDLALADLAGAGYGDLRAAHGFIVQHLIGGPCTVTELARLQGVSAQAISKTVAELVDLGYVAATSDPADRRQRRLELTARGRASVEASRTARRKVQRRIERKLGSERVAALTDELATVLSLLGGDSAVRQRRVRPPA